jgi:VIT1/CCC1 family predicted Fe2+/Mn2+ transporter
VESSTPPERKLGAAFDPRQRIQRDPFNEIFVLVLSAVSAAVVIPVVLLVVGAFTTRLDLVVFVAISAVAELILIFGIGRPQMKPLERVGWGLLWAFTAAVLGAAFWALVYEFSVS